MLWVQYAIFGLGVGAVFALLAAGIVLVYRATGVLNLAHASIGVLAGFINFTLLNHIPGITVGGALAIALASGALLGIASHWLVFRLVATAPPVVKLMTSFGLAGVVQGAIGLVWSHVATPTTYGHTLLPLNHGLELAGVRIPDQRLAVIALGAATTLALALLVKRTSFGIRLRALAQNPLAARLGGVDDRVIQTAVWAIAGATSALAAVLLLPFGPMNALALSGTQIQAFAAALVGGFVSLPAALIGGLGLGIAEQELTGAPAPYDAFGTALGTVLILVLLLLRIERRFVSDQEARAIEGDGRLFGRGVRLPLSGSPAGWLMGTVLLIVATIPMSGFWAFVTARATLYALLGLSLVVLTGWAGQVSLMPGTFAGVGACLAWVFGAKLGFALPLAVPLAALGTIPVCAVAGIAALRLPALYLAVATLALAQTFDETLFHTQWLANGGARMVALRPSWLAGDHVFGAFVIAVAGVVFAFTAGFARSRTGRALRTVRDNSRAAAAAGINPVKYRLLAFVFSAFTAGLMGALLAYTIGAYTSDEFSFFVLSLSAFGLAMVGGIRSPLGAVVGAFALIAGTEPLRNLATLDDWVTVSIGVGIVLVMVRNPDGLVGAAQKLVQRRHPLPNFVQQSGQVALTVSGSMHEVRQGGG